MRTSRGRGRPAPRCRLLQRLPRSLRRRRHRVRRRHGRGLRVRGRGGWLPVSAGNAGRLRSSRGRTHLRARRDRPRRPTGRCLPPPRPDRLHGGAARGRGARRGGGHRRGHALARGGAHERRKPSPTGRGRHSTARRRRGTLRLRHARFDELERDHALGRGRRPGRGVRVERLRHHLAGLVDPPHCRRRPALPRLPLPRHHDGPRWRGGRAQRGGHVHTRRERDVAAGRGRDADDHSDPAGSGHGLGRAPGRSSRPRDRRDDHIPRIPDSVRRPSPSAAASAPGTSRSADGQRPLGDRLRAGTDPSSAVDPLDAPEPRR